MLKARPRRSVLYLPGSNARALEKARTLPADCLILDLEDAVAPSAKAEARGRVCDAVGAGGFGRREVAIRINGLLSTEWGIDDLRAAGEARPHAIVLPKMQAPDDLVAARAVLEGSGTSPDIHLWGMMETPLGVLNAKEIGQAAANYRNPLTVMVMGTNDLANETNVYLGNDRLGILSWLSTCVAAAHGFGLAIVDGVYNDFRDEAGFRRLCEQGRQLGMDGKTLIHPSQIEICNTAFSPSEEEVEHARKLIAAFERPDSAGKGAIEVDGRMVELLHVGKARQTIAIAEEIAAAKD